jgi:predicted nucleic acid-binding Zn ribbon protein
MAQTHSTAPLADLLSRVLRGLKDERSISREEIQKAWGRLVGRKAARHSWPRSVTRGRLLVEVENSGWMYTLNLKRSQLLEGLIELLGAGRVKDLRFRIGEAKDA